MTMTKEVYDAVLKDAVYIGYEKPNDLTLTHIVTVYDKDKKPLRIYPLLDFEVVKELLTSITQTAILKDGTLRLAKARKGIARINR